MGATFVSQQKSKDICYQSCIHASKSFVFAEEESRDAQRANSLFFCWLRMRVYVLSSHACARCGMGVSVPPNISPFASGKSHARVRELQNQIHTDRLSEFLIVDSWAARINWDAAKEHATPILIEPAKKNCSHISQANYMQVDKLIRRSKRALALQFLENA